MFSFDIKVCISNSSIYYVFRKFRLFFCVYQIVSGIYDSCNNTEDYGQNLRNCEQEYDYDHSFYF